MEKYDVIIVGAGPAGLMAARVLKNTNYLVIDSKKDIGLPLKCGEGVKKRDLDEITNEKSFVRALIKEHELALNEHKRVLNIEYYKLDRPKFEKWLAKSINIRLNCKCEDIEIRKECAIVKTNKGVYQTKLVILAYGTNYHVQEKYGLIRNKPEQLICYGGVFKGCDVEPDKFIFYSDKDIMGGFWIFPNNKNEANIGFGSFKGNVKEIFYKLIKRFPELRNAKLVKEYGGIVPCSGPIEKTYYNRMMVCGNAAGQVYAGSGEGISYALISGKIAGETASLALRKNEFGEPIMSLYEKRWKKMFGQELEGGRICMDLLKIAYKYNLSKKAFYHPRHSELFDIVDKGKFPLRARFLWKLARLFNMDKNYEQRKKAPFLFMAGYKFARLFLK